MASGVAPSIAWCDAVLCGAHERMGRCVCVAELALFG